MTYSNSRFLGIVTNWSNEKGLEIFTGNNFGSFSETYRNFKNNAKDTANTVNFNVYVNDEKIDNSKEQYPLLSYRNVTYFPITYKFAVTNFGWEANFDENGLQVKSNKFDVETVDMENTIYDFEAYTSFNYYNGDYYFIDNYEVLEESYYDQQTTEKLYKYNYDTKEKVFISNIDKSISPKFIYIKNDELFLEYYTKGIASIGVNRYSIFENEINKSYSPYYHYHYLAEDLYYSTFAGDNYIYYYDDNKEYTITIPYKSEASINFSKTGEGDIVVGDNIYLIGRNDNIYKVNYKNEIIENINANVKVDEYYVLNNKIYFKNLDDKKLYVMDLDGNNVLKIVDDEVNDIIFRDGKVYYILQNDIESMIVYNINTSQKEIIALNFKSENFKFIINDNYIYFILNDNPNYKIQVIKNEQGNYSEVIKITDNIRMFEDNEWVDNFHILDDGIIYLNSENKELVKIKFN